MEFDLHLRICRQVRIVFYKQQIDVVVLDFLCLLSAHFKRNDAKVVKCIFNDTHAVSIAELDYHLKHCETQADLDKLQRKR